MTVFQGFSVCFPAFKELRACVPGVHEQSDQKRQGQFEIFFQGKGQKSSFIVKAKLKVCLIWCVNVLTFWSSSK